MTHITRRLVFVSFRAFFPLLFLLAMSMECDFDFDHIIRGTDDHKNHFDFVQNARRME